MRNGEYTLIVAPDDYPGKKYRGRYAYEHIVAFWKSNGRLPQLGHVVHHKNEKKRSNEPNNLEEKTVGQHNTDHNTVKPVQTVCGLCGIEFYLKPHTYRERIKKAKSGLLFCSRKHQVAWQHISGHGPCIKKPRSHGMYTMYRDGCRCKECKTANTQRCLAGRRKKKLLFRVIAQGETSTTVNRE